jgi:hypothetical protein
VPDRAPRAVGRAQQDDALRRVEAVEFGQELVESLFFLVKSASHAARCAGAAEGVKLVDEDDARLGLARLFKQIAHPRRPDTDEHLDELRT